MSTAAQLIGIGIIMAIAFAALYIAGDALRWRLYGRNALYAFGIYQLLFGATRWLVYMEEISRGTALTFNTIGAGVFLSILINLQAIRWFQTRTQVKEVTRGQYSAE